MKRICCCLFAAVVAAVGARGAAAEAYDVVVAGGGPAGIGAAYMAAKRGAKVLLLEKSGRLGGMAVQAMVSPFSKYTESPTVGRIMEAMRVGRTVDFAGADVRAYELLRSVRRGIPLRDVKAETLRLFETEFISAPRRATRRMK